MTNRQYFTNDFPRDFWNHKKCPITGIVPSAEEKQRMKRRIETLKRQKK